MDSEFEVVVVNFSVCYHKQTANLTPFSLFVPLSSSRCNKFALKTTTDCKLLQIRFMLSKQPFQRQ